MKPIIYTLAIITLVAGSIASDDVRPLISYIGSVNGTLYFSDSSELRTWTNAKAYCQDNGMQLARVETYDESMMLYHAYNESSFIGEFWTGARDSQKPTQFIWDHDLRIAPATEEYLWKQLYVKPEFEFQTCVYWKGMISHNILSLDLCTAREQTLCSIDTKTQRRRNVAMRNAMNAPWCGNFTNFECKY